MTSEQEALYVSVRDDIPITVEVKGHKFKLHWQRRGQWICMCKLMLNSENDTKFVCKCFAMRLCNTFWRMKLYYPILWRYLYYVLRIKENDRHSLVDISYKMTRLPDELLGDAILVDRKIPSWMYLPKKFFGGLITVPKWDFYWGFTQAQVALLLRDKTLINYRERHV